MAREIRLTRNKVAIVDDKDYEWLMAYGKWHFDGVYAATWQYEKGKQRRVRMHALLCKVPGRGYEVDHINGNHLDNRRCNLRAATRSQNEFNKGKRKDNTSGFKGVSWDRVKGKWRAYIRIAGRQQFLGYFKDPARAHAAYKKAARNIAGVFARGA